MWKAKGNVSIYSLLLYYFFKKICFAVGAFGLSRKRGLESGLLSIFGSTSFGHSLDFDQINFDCSFIVARGDFLLTQMAARDNPFDLQIKLNLIGDSGALFAMFCFHAIGCVSKLQTVTRNVLRCVQV